MSTEITDALNRIASRLDALEKKVDGMSPTASDGPISAKLQDDQVAERLGRLLDRLDEVERTLDTASSLAAKAPLIAEAAGEGVNYMVGVAAERGIDPIEQGSAAFDLALRLAEPKTMSLATRMFEHMDSVELLVAVLDDVEPEDLKTLTQEGTATARKLAVLLRTSEFKTFMDSGLLDAGTVGFAGTASTALVEARSQTPTPVGPFGAFMAMRDARVGKALGFALEVAKRFGERL